MVYQVICGRFINWIDHCGFVTNGPRSANIVCRGLTNPVFFFPCLLGGKREPSEILCVYWSSKIVSWYQSDKWNAWEWRREWILKIHKNGITKCVRIFLLYLPWNWYIREKQCRTRVSLWVCASVEWMKSSKVIDCSDSNACRSTDNWLFDLPWFYGLTYSISQSASIAS